MSDMNLHEHRMAFRPITDLDANAQDLADKAMSDITVRHSHDNGHVIHSHSPEELTRTDKRTSGLPIVDQPPAPQPEPKNGGLWA